ncbi:zinc ribbon domain-containing protein [Streptomyces pharetrae]|uniref:NADase-type glycan-binding domain-containing protein n=1 Tax=Streptomyces pharetrae TaxID=291370 RepID=UPI0036593296
MRACPSCGASNGPTDDFCGNCGSYLGWSDPRPAPDTPPEPPAAPDPAPTPAPPPEDEPAPPAPAPAAPPAPTASLRARLAGRNRGEAREPSAATAARSPGADDEESGTGPARTGTRSTPPRSGPDDTRTERPTRAPTDAPAHRPATGDGEAPDPGTALPTGPRPPSAPAAPSAPAPDAPAPDPVLPVQPARPVAPRPVVRPAAVPDEGAGVPCPACGALNSPDRRFCRRCATVLNPAAKPAPLPWWRTMWPLRRRVRAGSGRAVRLLVILAVLAAACAGGLLLLPAGRALVEDTRDKMSKAKPVTPVAVEAGAEVPRHPATNTTDGLSNRYWGAPAPGASVTYTFRKPFRLVDLIITNGASTSPESYPRQARALRLDLEVTTQDGERHHKELTLSDKPGPQTFPTGISDAKTIRLTLRSPAGLTPGRHLALAEVEFFARG